MFLLHREFRSCYAAVDTLWTLFIKDEGHRSLKIEVTQVEADIDMEHQRSRQAGRVAAR